MTPNFLTTNNFSKIAHKCYQIITQNTMNKDFLTKSINYIFNKVQKLYVFKITLDVSILSESFLYDFK